MQPPVSRTTTWKVIVVCVVPLVGEALAPSSESWWAAPLQPAAATTGIASERGSQAGTTSQLATTISVANPIPRTALSRARTNPVAPFAVPPAAQLRTVGAASATVSGAIGRARRYLRPDHRTRSTA
jgi:hypothetical protein